MKNIPGFLLALPLLTSCQLFGGNSEEAQALTEVVPYHLAIVVECTEGVTTTEQLAVLGGQMSDGLGHRFSKVTLIGQAGEEESEATPEGAGGAGVEDREGQLARYWPEAKRVGADVLLYAELNPANTTHDRRGGVMAANLLLFLIGGPLSWWLGDNEYTTNTNVVLRYYDVNRLERHLDEFPGASASCLCQDYTARSDPMTLSFEDRMENWGNWGYRALSIVIPASFLGSESVEAQAITEEGSRTSLVKSVVSAVDYSRILDREGRAFLQSGDLELSTEVPDQAGLTITLDVSRISEPVDEIDLKVGYYTADALGSPYVLLAGQDGESVSFVEVPGSIEGVQSFTALFHSSYVTGPGSSVQVQLETSDVTETWTFALDKDLAGAGPIDRGTS